MKHLTKLQDLEHRNFTLEEEVARQKELIASLIESQNIQKTILERSLVGYYITLHGKFYAMNPIAVSYTGYEADELIGKKAGFIIHPEDWEGVKKKSSAMLAGKLDLPYEYRIITKNKEIRWVMEVVAPILVSGQQAILGNAMDITHRKTAEQKVVESENLYRTIFETTGNMTMISDEDKTVLLLNSEFEKLTGFSKGDWEGKKKWTECVDERDLSRLEEYHRKRRINPDTVPQTYEFRLIDHRGQIKNLLATVNIIPGTKKHVSSSMDITELKEIEKQLIQKSEHLAELNTALKILLKQREDDRMELETTLLSNIKELVLPYIEKIREGNPGKKNLVYVDLLTSNLENIMSPFSRTLSAKFMNLTSKEIEVANYIKEGKNSKEIAALLNVSRICVDVHRYHIRSKLGLNKKKANLKAYLSSLA